MKSKNKTRSGEIDNFKKFLNKPIKKSKKKKLNVVPASGSKDDIADIPVRPSVRKQRPNYDIPKIRRPATSEDVEEKYMIVPWSSSAEWNAVCFDFHAGNFGEVIKKIGVWQKRVPALPVGVEATLFLIEAILYDQKFLARRQVVEDQALYTEDQARSLYSLAIIRYLNHVSHLAAQSLGESSSRPTRELAAAVDTPDWIVSLRNEISHGSTAPSIELLRMAGSFILEWLKTKYWKLPEEVAAPGTSGADDPFTIQGGGLESNDDAIHSQIDQLVAAYVASRIYKLRHIFVITDLEIIKQIYDPVTSLHIKTKTAMMTLRKRLRSYLYSHPSIFCAVVSQAFIPSPEFYDDFSSILRKNKEDVDDGIYKFRKFYGVWLPLVKMLETKGKLMSILSNLCDIAVNPVHERVWEVTALWIEKILEIIEESGKKYTNGLTKLLGNLVKHPNPCTPIFLERLFRLTEPRLGADGIQKLNSLVSIWLDDKEETKKRRKQSAVRLFSLNDIETGSRKGLDAEGTGAEGEIDKTNFSEEMPGFDGLRVWSLDQRGEDFWRNVPFGAVL